MKEKRPIHLSLVVRVCLAAAGLGAGIARGDADVTMRAGLDALYVRHQPAEAAEDFRGVLAVNPNHYGATFQLAKALDESGWPEQARPVWNRMLGLAESMKDAGTARIVRERLGKPDVVGQDALMRRGLDRLYRVGDPKGAAEQFREVLRQNPRHYGALYQLASVLDWTGRKSEARPYWEKVLTEARNFKDEGTIRAVNGRLKAKP